jgi:predicted solute-binding protein
LTAGSTTVKTKVATYNTQAPQGHLEVLHVIINFFLEINSQYEVLLMGAHEGEFNSQTIKSELPL